jgi:hypothetical protein
VVADVWAAAKVDDAAATTIAAAAVRRILCVAFMAHDGSAVRQPSLAERIVPGRK